MGRVGGGRMAELCASLAVKFSVAMAKNVVYWFTHAHIRRHGRDSCVGL